MSLWELAIEARQIASITKQKLLLSLVARWSLLVEKNRRIIGSSLEKSDENKHTLW